MHNPPRVGLWLALIFAVSVGIFTPTLINGYTYDDPHYARVQTPTGTTNPMVAELRPFTEYWSKPMNWGLPTHSRGFRPVTVYSYAIVNALCPPTDAKGDDNAWAHHLLNLLLHGLATLLVYALVGLLLGTGPALVAMLVFGVHALHSGAVAAIVGRAEILAFVAGAAATVLYSRAFASSRRTRVVLWTATAALALLSFGSKESAVALAVFAPLVARGHGVDWRRQLVPGLLTLGAPLIVFLLLRQHAIATHVTPHGPFWVEYDANPLYYLPFLERVINGTSVLAFGLGKVLFPCNLSSNYGDGPFTLFHSVFHWKFVLSSGLLVAILVAAIRGRRRHPVLFLAAAAFFGFTFITSNIPFPIETIFGDRLYYAAVLAIALVAAWIADRLPDRGRGLATAGLVVWVGWSAMLSVERSRAWFDNTTLTTADLRSQPESVGLHIDMGNLHLWNFDAANGRREFEAALDINPHSARALRFLAENSDDETAEVLLLRALASPHLVRGTEGRRLHWALGSLREKAGDRAAALQAFERAIECNPYVLDIRLHVLRETAKQGDFERFERVLDAGLALDPQSRLLTLYSGVLLHHRREYAAAAATFGRLLPGLPDEVYVVEIWLRHADCLVHLGRPVEARRIAEMYRRMATKFPDIQVECTRILGATAPR